MKLIDGLFIVILGYVLYQFYLTDPIFDLIAMASLLYVAVRQYKDVNVLSLCIVGLIFKLVVMAIASGASAMSGFVYWPLTILVYLCFIAVVVHRPVLFSNFGPLKRRTGWAITNADDAIILVLVAMAIFNGLMFIEHVVRHTIYSIRFFYDSYEYVQIFFAMASTAILLFVVNTDKGKEKSRIRQ